VNRRAFLTLTGIATALSAVNTMREHSLAKLPVVDDDRALKGYVRLENMERVLRQRAPLAHAVDEGR
jgi:CBS-domain-containing membrane protein